MVFEERRLRTESTPLGKFDEAFNALFWEAHPYNWPVVGWASDIPMYTLAQAKDYFATYYAPNNLTGVLVGDFKTAEVKPLLERYFGRIPRGTVEPPAGRDPRAEAARREALQRRGRDLPHRAHLVEGRALRPQGRAPPSTSSPTSSPAAPAGSTRASSSAGRSPTRPPPRSTSGSTPGIFEVEATVKDGKEPAAVEAAVYEEIEKLQKEPVPAEELQKVKNQLKANAYRRLSIALLHHVPAPDLRRRWATGGYINTAPERGRRGHRRPTSSAWRRSTSPRRTARSAIFLRKEGAAPEDPEIASCPPQAQAMVRQALKQIEAETDAGEAPADGMAQMQQMAGQVPPEMKPAFDLILKRAEERLRRSRGEKK